MSEGTAPGWMPDPYGRYALRYWDGSTWTATVSDGAGGQYTDPPVPSAPGAPASYGAPATYGAPAARSSSPPTAGLILVAAGALCVILSDFVLSWFSGFGGEANFSDLRDIAGQSSEVPFLSDQYLTWGWIVAFAAIGLGVAALFNPKLRVIAAVVLFAFAAWHGYTAYDASSSDISPDFGAWLGSIGFIVCGAATLLPQNLRVGYAR